MTDPQTSHGWLNRGLFAPPRGGTLSWVVLGLAVLYSVLAPLYYPQTIVGVPIALLFAIAEVVPKTEVGIAGVLRLVGFVYIFTTPLLFVYVS